jgi:nitroreductase
MEFEQLSSIIRGRRAVFSRHYTGADIDRQTILELLENANWAPTHRHTEPWRFYVVTGEGRLRLGRYMAGRYRAITPEESFSEQRFSTIESQPLKASAVIGLGMRRDPQERVPEWEEIAALGAAVQNLWLSAWARGLAGYWSTPATMVGDQAFFGMEPGERCMGLFYLSTWEPEELPSRRGPIEDKLRWIAE